MLPVAGGAIVRASVSESFEDGAPSAAPDGLSIAFESHRTSDEESPTDIWVVDTPQVALLVAGPSTGR